MPRADFVECTKLLLEESHYGFSVLFEKLELLMKVAVMVLVHVSTLLCLWWVVSAEKLYEKNSDSVLTAEIIRSASGVSRLQCLHKCERHGECIDIGIRDDGVCLLLRNTSSKVKSDEVPDSLNMAPNVERISVVPLLGIVCLSLYIS